MWKTIFFINFIFMTVVVAYSKLPDCETPLYVVAPQSALNIDRKHTPEELLTLLKSGTSEQVYNAYREVKYRIETIYISNGINIEEKENIDRIMFFCIDTFKYYRDILPTKFTLEELKKIPDQNVNFLRIYFTLQIIYVGYAYDNKISIDFVNKSLHDYISEIMSDFLKRHMTRGLETEKKDKQMLNGYLELSRDYEYLKGRLLSIMKEKLWLSSPQAYAVLFYLRYNKYESFWNQIKKDENTSNELKKKLLEQFFINAPEYAYLHQLVFYRILRRLSTQEELKSMHQEIEGNPKASRHIKSYLFFYIKKGLWNDADDDDDDDDDDHSNYFRNDDI